MASTDETEAERYALQLGAILLAVLVAYCCSLAAGRRGTGLGTLVWDTLTHVGCIQTKSKGNELEDAEEITEQEFEELQMQQAEMEYADHDTIIQLEAEVGMPRISETMDNVSNNSSDQFIVEQPQPSSSEYGNAGQRIPTTRGSQPRRSTLASLGYRRTSSGSGGRTSRQTSAESRVSHISTLSAEELEEHITLLERAHRCCGRGGRIARFCDSKAPRRFAAFCGVGALVLMCVAAAGLSHRFAVLEDIHWARFVVLSNDTTVNRTDLTTAIDALANCSGEDFFDEAGKPLQSISGVLGGLVSRGLPGSSNCELQRSILSAEQHRLAKLAGTTIYIGLNRVAEKTIDGNTSAFGFNSGSCNNVMGEDRCESCSAALPGTFFVLLGIYAQVLGAIFAISRFKDKNNGLCLHLMATFGTLLAFSTVNATPWLFERECYREVVHSRNTLLYEKGNADSLTQIAGLIILCQFVSHVLSQHDPDVPFLAGTPWRFCFDIHGQCLKKNTNKDGSEGEGGEKANESKENSQSNEDGDANELTDKYTPVDLEAGVGYDMQNNSNSPRRSQNYVPLKKEDSDLSSFLPEKDLTIEDYTKPYKDEDEVGITKVERSDTAWEEPIDHGDLKSVTPEIHNDAVETSNVTNTESEAQPQRVRMPSKILFPTLVAETDI